MLDLASKHQEISLRVRVVSLTNKSISVEHAPLFIRRSSAVSDQTQVLNKDEKAPLPYGILELRLAGIETPLIDRAMTQLKHPEVNMFGEKTYWNAVISNKLNNMSDVSESVPGLFKRG